MEFTISTKFNPGDEVWVRTYDDRRKKYVPTKMQITAVTARARKFDDSEAVFESVEYRFEGGLERPGSMVHATEEECLKECDFVADIQRLKKQFDYH